MTRPEPPLTPDQFQGSDQFCVLCQEPRPCIHNIAPELFCGCGCGNPRGDS